MLQPTLSTQVAVQRRVVRALSTCQVLGGIGVATGLTVSTLVAASISGSDLIGGLAATCAVVGAALMSIPMARLAARRGRRPALLAGYAVATVGATVAALGAALGNAAILLTALVAVGGGTAAGLAARYAATDLAAPGRRARDLSLVVWAMTIGSVAGPNLAGPAQDVAAGSGLAAVTGPFLLSGVAFGLAGVAVAVGLRPDPLQVVWADSLRSGQVRSGPVPGDVTRSGAVLNRAIVAASTVRPRSRDRAVGWRVLWGSPPIRLALTGVVLGHTVMVALMSMTPVHIAHGGASLQMVGVVISLHITGMFALSPLIGWMADRMGRVPVLALGAGVLVVAAAVGAAPTSGAVQLSVGLVLLGLGWSCALVAGSTLLTESVPAAARPEAQGVSDLLMNAGGALGGALAGAAVAVTSYGALSLACGLLVLPFCAVIVSTSLGRG
ncbi:MAG: MFS transporter [Pseudonocardiaceae bacterium]